MVRWIAALVPVLLFAPLSAMAAEHCPHGQSDGVQHIVHAEQIENIPASGGARCPEHEGSHALAAGTMPSCAMEGCCIKADGPRTAGLSSRPPVNDRHALGVSVGQCATGGRLIAAAPYLFHPLRGRAKPPHHPPSMLEFS